MILDWLLFLSVPFGARCWVWVPHVEDLAVTSGCVSIVAFVIYLCIHGIFPYPFYFYCFACPACDGFVTISWGLFCLLPFLGKFCVQIDGGFVLGVHLFCLEPLNRCDNKVRTWLKRKVHRQKGKSRSPTKQLTIVIFLTG